MSLDLGLQRLADALRLGVDLDLAFGYHGSAAIDVHLPALSSRSSPES
jgi:hypothetical protein